MCNVKFYFGDRYSCDVEFEPSDTMVDVSKIKNDLEREFGESVTKIELVITTH